ncbi:MAG: dockerin type I domain-containing protein [Chthoniobacterales bacterium]
MPIPDSGEDEATGLERMELYWADRVTYPTGKFNPEWLREAARQDQAIESGVPAGSFERLQREAPRGLLQAKGAKSKQVNSLATTGWTPLGPAPERMTGCSGCFDYTKTEGRVNAIVVDPTTVQNGSIVAYAGTVGGGVWKTTNCCSTSTTWTSMTNDPLISTVAIDTLALDPNNHNTIYAGTGDLNFGSFSMGSQGILKSTDGGNSWTVLGANIFGPSYDEPAGQFPQYNAVGKVRVDPNNSKNVVAGTKKGLYFSYDGGLNWLGPIAPGDPTQRQDITGLELSNVGGTTRILAVVGTRGFATPVQYDLGLQGANGIYRATMPANGAPSFTPISTNANGFVFGTAVTGSPYTTGQPLNATSGTPYASLGVGNQASRIDIAVAPSDPNVIYAQVGGIAPQNNSGGSAGCGNNNGCQLGAFVSTNGGDTWTFMPGSAGGSLKACASSGPGTSATAAGDYNQNWYDQGVAVDPNNPNRVFFDTFEVWLATNGGNTWYDTSCAYSQSSQVGMHADEHVLTFVPGSSSILLAGNDGGVDATTNADQATLNTLRPNWFNIDNGLNTIEFYAGDISGSFALAANPQAVGGAQDNGPSSVTFNGSPTAAAQWQMGLGGDGFSGQIQTLEQQATGTITVSAAGTAGQQFQVGSQIFTWAATRTTTGTVAIGTSNTTAATNIRTAINADIPSQATAGGTGATVLVVSTVPGAAGNSVPFMNINSTNLTFNGSGTLGGTTAGGGLQNIFWEGNNSGGLSRCVLNCTVGGASWASSRGAWTGDQQSFVLPVNLFHGGISGGDDCAPSGASNGCGHMLAGTTRVWETVSGTQATVPSASWYVTNNTTTTPSCGGTSTAGPCLTKGTLGNRSYINQVKYSPKYDSVAIVGTNDGNVQIGFNLGTGVANQANWVDVTGSNAVLPNRPILGISLDPSVSAANVPVGYAAVGGFNENTPGTPGHLFQVTCTANCASFTWVNKTGNLPNVPVDSVINNPNFPQQVFAGTDWGVYFTNNITAASPVWFRFDNGMPHTMIWDFQIDRGSTTLSAWTRGRGAWVFPLPSGTLAQPPVLTSAVSRITHTGGMTFDVNLPVNGGTGYEPRSNGSGNYTVILTYDQPVSSGNVSVTNGTGNASNVTFSGNTVTVSLSGVTDVQVLTVSANGVSNGNTLGASNDVRVGFLVGDVNGDGAVNVADAYLTRSYSGQPLGAGNFRGDVNTDGALNAADATMVRNNSGHGF